MTTTLTADRKVTLHVPDDDVLEPDLSIVIPALNEELTVTQFVAWCKEGLGAAGVVGEILIVDSSDDRTGELALAGGARVLRTPRRGLGRAYIDALPFVRGKWIVMGDADCTYDFRQLEPFIERFREGYEYVMGSRWKGSIEPGSMPALHRHLGTPLTTWILNRLYSSKFSDIHCGMRGHHARCAAANEPAVAIVGVRIRDGVEVGAHEAAHRRGAGDVPEGSRRTAQPPQARGLALALQGGVDQPSGDVHLWLGLLLVQARRRADGPRALAHGSGHLRRHRPGCGCALAELAVPRCGDPRGRVSDVLLRLHRASVVRLHGPQRPSMVARVSRTRAPF